MLYFSQYRTNPAIQNYHCTLMHSDFDSATARQARIGVHLCAQFVYTRLIFAVSIPKYPFKTV